MPVRVEFTTDAANDLFRYTESGNLELFLKKLIRLEEVGEDAGLPLRRDLTGWRKIVVGKKDWRIIFSMNDEKTTATVWVVGDRSDAECYDEATRRVRALALRDQHAVSLAALMVELLEMQRERKRSNRRRR